jgi:uncharacterized protein
MTARGIDDVSGDTTYYVPRYRLILGDKEVLDHDSDFLSVQFKDSIKDLSGFELTLNNWDDGDGQTPPHFKYTDDERAFVLGQRAKLAMGYADAPGLETMMIGEITALDPQFPASGAPTITVRGIDRIHRMRNRPRTRSWENVTDHDIAKKIAEENQMGFEGDPTSPKHAVVPQNNLDNIAFLLERAKRINFEVFTRNDKLVFRKPRETEDAELALEWGSTLVSFTPSLTLARQISKVTVRFWDKSKGELVEKSVDRQKLAELSGGGKDAGKVLEEALGESKEEIITREAITSEEDAQNLAISVLTRSSYAFVTGAAQTVGTPLLRAGTTVELRKLGKKFDGKYYITESTHKIDSSGYQTTINVRKVFA